MSWTISDDDIQAIKILQRDGQKSLTDLVREIYGIEVDENGKEDNADRLKKLNRFKNHLKIMVNEGFLTMDTAKTKTSSRAITVYSLNNNVVIGRGALVVVTDSKLDFTEIGNILKITNPNGITAILPIEKLE